MHIVSPWGFLYDKMFLLLWCSFFAVVLFLPECCPCRGNASCQGPFSGRSSLTYCTIWPFPWAYSYLIVYIRDWSLGTGGRIAPPPPLQPRSYTQGLGSHAVISPGGGGGLLGSYHVRGRLLLLPPESRINETYKWNTSGLKRITWALLAILDVAVTNSWAYTVLL
jgi:hypothetical protein